MPRARTGVRRQCAVCSRSGRIASGITLRRLRGGASEALVPECRRCPPATVGALSGGTVAGETRRKGAQHSPVKEIKNKPPPNGDILMKNKKGTKNKGECPLPRSENERKSDCSLQNAERMSVPAFSRRAEEQRMSKKRHCRDFGSANCFASAVTMGAWRTSRT